MVIKGVYSLQNLCFHTHTHIQSYMLSFTPCPVFYNLHSWPFILHANLSFPLCFSLPIVSSVSFIHSNVCIEWIFCWASCHLPLAEGTVLTETDKMELPNGVCFSDPGVVSEHTHALRVRKALSEAMATGWGHHLPGGDIWAQSWMRRRSQSRGNWGSDFRGRDKCKILEH